MMTKKILGLDLGVTSIGWAFVHQNLKNPEENKIIKLGVRVNPLTTDEQTNFEKGKPITTNAGRTLARSARRNLQRFKLRRENLINVLQSNNIISESAILTETGKNSTFETQRLRANGAKDKISKEELARVFLLINKKRGYKSSRKAKNDDEGQIIDGMAVARALYEQNLTPGQFSYNLLKEGKKHLPDFYRSDLQSELDKVWNFQKKFYPEILTDAFKKELEGKGQRATVAIFIKEHKVFLPEFKGSREEKKLNSYRLRSEAIATQLDKSEVALVITEINNNLNNSSGYLGAISDRSKELYFNKQTVGQYLYEKLKKNPHARLKNEVFYRQDYLDEFEKLWETQSKFHAELTNELKSEVRDIVIFYQRKLKSQKGLISFCEFENKEIEINVNGKIKKKTVGLKAIPKSSPLFQEFKIWQILNNLEIKKDKEKRSLTLDEKEVLFEEVNIKGNIKAEKALKLIGQNPKDCKLNYTQIEGNRTNESLYGAFLKILEAEGYDIFELLKVKERDEVKLSELDVNATEIEDMVAEIFKANNIDAGILQFNADLENPEFEKQKSFQLWHLLYSYEEDSSSSGNERLYSLLREKFGFKEEHAKILGNISFVLDYGGLSSKAIRKILPYLKENNYADACVLAGYKHSNWETKEDLEDKILLERLQILPKNALRNPVVEKILNQMVNVINAVIDDPELGKPDEIRIELARELKKNAEERAEMTKSIADATNLHLKYAETLKKEFGLRFPSRNDIIRYKLYLELEKNAYKDLYTDTKIEKLNLFTNKYDIDHIIPQSRFFDDSFSNKVLVPRQANLDKGNMTAFDYIGTGGSDKTEKFLSVITDLYEGRAISKAKFEKLKKKASEIGEGFIERDLRDSQYIAKKAKQMLLHISKHVISTTGSITDKLRKDWGLINTMKELNIAKYRTAGLTEIIANSKEEEKEIIKDWTKRNDHRHHAMDALTVAFTTHNHIQYLNNLSARRDENHKKHSNIFAIENVITEELVRKNGSKERRFKSPMKNFRSQAKHHLEEMLISHKAKNKVVTSNINNTQSKKGIVAKKELTPRGQLHKETIYGRSKFIKTKEEKITAKFDKDTIDKVANPQYRKALHKRLNEFENDPKKAFSGKNALNKNPILLNGSETEKLPESVKLVWYENGFTIKKEVNENNFKDYKNIEKVVDKAVRIILTERLKEFGGNAKEAFSDLEKNPIWLNKEKGIAIKRVTITGVTNAEPLHFKKDHFGNEMQNGDGNKIPVNFVSTGNNHHVAIYKDVAGNLQESVVSFYEAVERVNQGLPVIDKDYNTSLGWEFQFTMKQNELFLFPSEDFNPNEIDVLDNKYLKIISKNLFRVQKLATKDYNFRHHLETKVEDNNALYNSTYRRLRNANALAELVKIRINHLGKIVYVGEY